MSKRKVYAPQSVQDIQTTCYVRSTLGLECVNCMYYNQECEEHKRLYKVDKPMYIDTINYHKPD